MYFPGEAETEAQRESRIFCYLRRIVSRSILPHHLAVTKITALTWHRGPIDSLLPLYSLPQTMLNSTVSPLDPWVLHLQIQLTADRKY